jgi:hypothetical protein
MSKCVFQLGAGMVLVALAFLLTDAMLWQPGVTEANARQVREGMTARQIEDILGPPNVCLYHHVTGHNQDFHPRAKRHEIVGHGRPILWNWGTATSRYRAHVIFDEDGLALEIICIFRPEQPRPSLLASLRSMLGW